MRILNFVLKYSCFLLFIFWSETISSQIVNEISVPYGMSKSLFEGTDPIKIMIAADFDAFRKDIGEERGYHPATLTYRTKTDEPKSVLIEIRVRGNFRRNNRVCDFPPVRLRLPKTSRDNENPFFDENKNLKLVTHCRSNNANYQQFVIKEYLIYRAYNLFTEYSFRARLAEITYIDLSGKSKIETKYGFFIESTEEMLARIKMTELPNIVIPPYQTNQEVMATFDMFQYMIGNTDWSTAAQHNVLLARNDNPYDAPVAIPYDFDWSGLVNAPYAVPQPDLGIPRVVDRLYRGYCRTPEEYKRVIEIFNNNRKQLTDLFYYSEQLNAKQLKKALKYIDSFYKTINSERNFKSQIEFNCLKKEQ